MWRKQGNGPGLSGAVGTALLMGLAAPFLVIPAYWIIFNGGVWWIPLLFGYLSLFFIAMGYLLSQKAMIEERAQIGEEGFLRMHPDERLVELRQVRKNRQAGRVTAVLDEYAKMTPLATYDENWEDREKRRRRGTALYRAAGIAMVLIAVYLITALILDGRSGRFDVPEIMAFLAIIFLIAAAIPLFQNRIVPLLSLSAGIVLFVATWARLTLILKKGISVPDSRLVEFLALTVLFAFFSYVFPKLGKRELEIADAPDLDRQLQLELFELGAITENELRYRMKQYY